jgi:hypothetical protein
MLIGCSLGIITNYGLGLPPFSGKATGAVTGTVTGWIIKSFSLLSFAGMWWWLVMVICSLLLYKRRRLLNSWRDSGRSLFSTMFVPLTVVYVSIIGGVILPPLNIFLLEFYGLVEIYSIALLVFLPFVLLELYLVFPQLRTRMRHNLRMVFTQRYWRKVCRKPKSCKKLTLFLILVVIVVIVDIWRFLLG